MGDNDEGEMTNNRYDIGHGHTLRYTSWCPDRELNPQYDGIPDVDRYGATIEHPHPQTGHDCGGMVTFAGEVADRLDPDRPKWTVESWEPLTISPSVLCRVCGDHGWIRAGQWVPA